MFNGGDHTGKKRNYLLSIAKGEYVTFIDDDDMVTDCFISEVLKVASTGCDVMGMKGWITENGANRVEFNIAIENEYERAGNIYFRHPNHITPMKRLIALQVGFPDISHGEDYDFSVRLKAMGLCKTQTYIDTPIYHYDYSTHNKIHP
jgi:glycosyltransferase involved in cell wall biosynthesis